MNIKKVAIFGAGVMGQGLAQAVASAGFEVLLIDETEEHLKEGLQKINLAMDAEIARWGLTESEKKAIASRITTSTRVEDAAKVGLVIVTIHENLAAKKALLASLEGTCPPETVFISDSATIAASDLSYGLKHPGRIVGMHFLNPARKVPMVEVGWNPLTGKAAFESARWFARSLEKTPITVFETPGFISTRVVVPMINQSVKVLEEGLASCDDIDQAMKLGFGLNSGPLALADRIGLETLLLWMENLLRETGDLAFRPARLLRKMVRAGWKGLKSGRGFYRYGPDGLKTEGSGLQPTDLTTSGFSA